MPNTPPQQSQRKTTIQSPLKKSNEIENKNTINNLQSSTSHHSNPPQDLQPRKQIRTLKKQFTKPNLSTPIIPSSQTITPNLNKISNNSSNVTSPTLSTSITVTKDNNDNGNGNKDEEPSSVPSIPTTNISNNTDRPNLPLRIMDYSHDQIGSINKSSTSNKVDNQQYNKVEFAVADTTATTTTPITTSWSLEKKITNHNTKQTTNINHAPFVSYNDQKLQLETKVQPMKKPLKKNWGKQKEQPSHQSLGINLDNQDLNVNANNLLSPQSTFEKPKKTKRGRPPMPKTANGSINDNEADDSIKLKKMNKKSLKPSVDTTIALYCICQTPYDAPRFMIACDKCDQWFHGECINISEKEGEFVDLYFCPKCSKETGKTTSWKPKCINPTCSKAARISTNQGYKSKYCSHDCGMVVARSRLESADKKRYTTTEDKDIYELIISQRKRCRLLSYAHKEDHEFLEKLKVEKKKIQEAVHLIDLKLMLLELVIQQAQPFDICGFDSRLTWDDIYWKEVVNVITANDGHDIILQYTSESKSANKSYHQCRLKKKECQRHSQWQKLLTIEMEQERKEQLNSLISLDKEKRNIKTRIHQRSDDKEIVNLLSNNTTIH